MQRSFGPQDAVLTGLRHLAESRLISHAECDSSVNQLLQGLGEVEVIPPRSSDVLMSSSEFACLDPDDVASIIQRVHECLRRLRHEVFAQEVPQEPQPEIAGHESIDCEDFGKRDIAVDGYDIQSQDDPGEDAAFYPAQPHVSGSEATKSDEVLEGQYISVHDRDGDLEDDGGVASLTPLQSEAENEAEQKSFCDKAIGEACGREAQEMTIGRLHKGLLILGDCIALQLKYQDVDGAELWCKSWLMFPKCWSEEGAFERIHSFGNAQFIAITRKLLGDVIWSCVGRATMAC